MARITRRELIQGVAAAGVVPALLVHAGAADAASVALAGRGSTRLDFDWRFKLGHASDPARDFDWGSYQRTYAKSGEHTATAAQLAFDDSDWAAVQLPHDWAVGLPFAPSSGADAAAEEDPRAAHGYKPVGREFPETSVGWYRLRLDVPAADLGRAISLEFDGVFRDCLVFCNGHVVGRNESGYAPFRVELGDFLEYGATNLIAVRVDASLGEGWFYEGAGIYRPVRLVKTAPLHIPQWGVQVIARVEGAAASLSVETQLVNDGVQAQGVRLVSEVLAADGHVLAQHASDAPPLAAGESRTLRQSLRLDHAVLWSVEQPHLYRLRSRVLVGSTELDAVETPFGVRTVRFDAQQGFFLNGQPLKLQGTCNHQDHAGVGAAMPDALIDWRVQRLKALGSNAYRSAHNPPSSALLEACDRHGLLVIDEVRLMSSDDEALGQLERMIRRDRNHPSVILWSLGNEEPQMVRDRGARIVRRMKRLANRLDPTRLTTFAMDKGFGTGVAQVVDVLGFNYRTEQMGGYHARVPTQPIIGTETGSTVCTRGIYRRDDVKGYVRAYDLDFPWWASTAEAWWSYAEPKAYIGGGFVWTGFDYRGEPTPFNRFPSISSHFGIMDTCGFEKDNFHYYRARWQREPVLHLLPHWNWSAADGPIDVWCHTNLDEAELFLNGRSLGRRTLARNGHLQWQVAFEPGVLEARGYRAGQQVMSARRETAGPATQLLLSASRTQLRADGQDVAMVRCEVQDAQGRFVALADDEVSFTVVGPGAVIGVGNGNPVSLEADKASRRRAFNGLCQAIVQAARTPGRVQLTASAPGLAAATLALEVSTILVAHEVDRG